MLVINQSDTGYFAEDVVSANAGLRIRQTGTPVATDPAFAIDSGAGVGNIFKVQNNGSVGIGTTAPASPYKLDVLAPANTAAVAQFEGNMSNGGYITLYDAINSVVRGFVGYGANVHGSGLIGDFGLRSQGALAFDTNGGYTRMYVDTSGNVGIGTTSPTNSLTIDSEAASSPIVANSYMTYDTFSVLPWSGVTYLGSGLYYKNSSFVHRAAGTTNALFAFGGGGASWYASNNSAPSWNLASGVTLWTAAGVLQGASSKSIKENYEALDFNEVLNKIESLPVERWNYKSEGAGIKHIGPYAEDFKAAFGVGESDKSIALVDEAGIALAGVKGLAMEVRELQKENAELKEAVCEMNPGAKICHN